MRNYKKVTNKLAVKVSFKHCDAFEKELSLLKIRYEIIERNSFGLVYLLAFKHRKALLKLNNNLHFYLATVSWNKKNIDKIDNSCFLPDIMKQVSEQSKQTTE